MSFDRYRKFKENGTVQSVPFVKIPRRNTDVYDFYVKDQSRMDLISYKYYGDPNYGWLIMYANPELNDMEFLNSEPVEIRIPMPLEQVLNQYDSDIENYKKLYSVE